MAGRRLQPNEFGDGRACPWCRSGDPVEVLIGDPVMTPEVQRRLVEGSLVLGGCEVPDRWKGQPCWSCPNCGTEWWVDQWGRRFTYREGDRGRRVAERPYLDDPWLVLPATYDRDEMRIRVGSRVWIAYGMGDMGPATVESFTSDARGEWEVFVRTERAQQIKVVNPWNVFSEPKGDA